MHTYINVCAKIYTSAYVYIRMPEIEGTPQRGVVPVTQFARKKTASERRIRHDFDA